MEELIAMQGAVLRLSKRKAELKHRIIEAIEENLETTAYHDDFEESKTITQTLRQHDANTIVLLQKARLPIEPPSAKLLSGDISRPGVIVHSTQGQAEPQTGRTGSHAASSGAIALTQFVMQTQAGRDSPQTPSKTAISRNAHPVYDVDIPRQSKTNRSPNRPPVPDVDAFHVATYFSPSKRSGRQKGAAPLTLTHGVDEHSYSDRQSVLPPHEPSPATRRLALTSKRSDRFTHERNAPEVYDGPLNDEYEEKNENYFDDDEEALFSMVMGTPPARVEEDDGEYGRYDDDDEMLEMAENLENQGSRYAMDRNFETRDAFREMSGNRLTRPKELHKAPARKTLAAATQAPPAVLMQYSWSQDVKKVLKERFHLRGFRQNQLEAINATLG
ncbi:ATP-dependent DNA helicase sgs1, partial [Cryomyces antarcticus]